MADSQACRGSGWSPEERRLLATLSTPEKIQRFLDEEVGYNKKPHGETCGSPRRVFRDRLARCHDYNLAGERSLRSYTSPVDLSRFDRRGWEWDEQDLWDVSRYLATRRFHPVVTPRQASHLPRLDARLYRAELLGAVGVGPGGSYRRGRS